MAGSCAHALTLWGRGYFVWREKRARSAGGRVMAEGKQEWLQRRRKRNRDLRDFVAVHGKISKPARTSPPQQAARKKRQAPLLALKDRRRQNIKAPASAFSTGVRTKDDKSSTSLHCSSKDTVEEAVVMAKRCGPLRERERERENSLSLSRMKSEKKARVKYSSPVSSRHLRDDASEIMSPYELFPSDDSAPPITTAITSPSNHFKPNGNPTSEDPIDLNDPSNNEPTGDDPSNHDPTNDSREPSKCDPSNDRGPPNYDPSNYDPSNDEISCCSPTLSEGTASIIAELDECDKLCEEVLGRVKKLPRLTQADFDKLLKF